MFIRTCTSVTENEYWNSTQTKLKTLFSIVIYSLIQVVGGGKFVINYTYHRTNSTHVRTAINIHFILYAVAIL